MSSKSKHSAYYLALRRDQKERKAKQDQMMKRLKCCFGICEKKSKKTNDSSGSSGSK